MESNTFTTHHLWATFSDYNLAAQAAAAFVDHGVPQQQVYIVAQEVPAEYTGDKTEAARSQAESGVTVTTAADAGIGASKGLGVGLGVGILAGLAAIAVPGFGLVIGGGALAVAAAGAAGTAAAGALAGAVTGYLKDQGASDVMVRHVTDRLAAGDILVHADFDPEVLPISEADELVLKYGGSQMPTPVGATSSY